MERCRPICATTLFFKILEAIAKGRLEELEKQGMIRKLNQEQFGFRSGLGTEPQILRLMTDAY